MSTEDVANVIDAQVKIQLQEKGMGKTDLSEKEFLQWKLDMAIKMLVEL